MIRQTQTLNSLPLSYLEWGAGDLILLLHGLGDHGGVWQGLAPTLADRYHVIAPDLRGHGDSGKPTHPEAYDSLTLVADLEALAQAQGWTQITVVAHSWAAKLALLWAQQSSQRVGRLGLVDPFFVNRLPGAFRLTFPLLYRTLPFLKVMGPFESYPAATAMARTLKQYRGWSALQQAVFKAGMAQKPDGSWGSKFAIAARNGVFNDILRRAGLTTEISVPTLLLLPEQGLNRFGWQIEPYKTYLPQLQIQTLPGNHWPHLVEPEAFNRVVWDYLDQALRE
ncbi:MAG: alpha/beta hydrolase [Leptolyngbyaceae cyanobacterium SM2_3_12]|nr:alpha/beta hydrolase [Leptolyngbyaceae cyanobacterium SM2_3_12]